MQSSTPNAAKAMCAQKPLHIITTSFLDGNEVLAGFSDGTAAIFEAAGTTTVHNVAGANMAGGVASALLAPRRGAGGG